MALVVPQAALVRLIWTLGGVPYAVNVLGVRKTGAAIIDQASANAIGGAVKGALSSSTHAANLSTTVALASVGTRDISSANNVEFIDTGAPVAGVGGTGLLPLQVAYCVTLRTARAGKSFRGRVYLPGFQTSANDATGHVVAGNRDVAVGFVDAIRAALPAQGVTLSIVSRKNLTTEPVTAVQGRDLIWDTIRGRAVAGI
jgi:hypothetical protein